MTKVLFVCLGNICRSPLAEAIFNHQIKKAGLADKVQADSCGTGNYHIGSQPDTRTIAVALKQGVPIQHACRQLRASDLDAFDFIIAMDKSNHRNILSIASPHQHAKVILMRQFDPEPEGYEVPDPYYGGPKEFQEVYEILERSVAGFVARHVKG